MPTTTHETTISEQLRALARLQHFDSRIDQVEKLRGDLPDEIRDLEDERAGLETRIAKQKEEQDERNTAKLQSERDIVEAEALIKKYEEQQLQVRNNREYDALTKEIEAQKQRIIDAKAQIENYEATAAGQDQIVEEAEGRLQELDDVLTAKRKELDEVLEDTKHEQEALEARRNEAAEAVDERYRRAYERLRDRMRDGRAVVPLERGAAAGFAVPPQRQVEIRQRTRIIACEHTGRIIVDSDLFEETRGEVDK